MKMKIEMEMKMKKEHKVSYRCSMPSNCRKDLRIAEDYIEFNMNSKIRFENLDFRNYISEFRIKKSAFKNQHSEIRIHKSEVRIQKSEF